MINILQSDMHKKRILSLSLLSLCAGCTVLSPKPAQPLSTTKEQTIEQKAQEKKIENITHWSINGALGVKQGQKAWSARLQWQQMSPSSYQVALFGPFGAGRVDVVGSASGVTLRTADKRTRSARTPEELIRAETGWDLPMTSLYYWVRGLPVPGGSAKTQYADNHIASLQQNGWNVQYERFTTVQGLALPSLIVLTKSPFVVRVAINQWSI